MRVLLALPKSRDVLHRADAHRVPFPCASSRCLRLPWEPSPARMHARRSVGGPSSVPTQFTCPPGSHLPASRAFVTPNGRRSRSRLFPDRCMPPFPRRPPSSAGQPEARPQGRLHHRRAELVEGRSRHLRIPAVTVSTRLASCDSCVSLERASFLACVFSSCESLCRVYVCVNGSRKAILSSKPFTAHSTLT